jgi:peptidoglycan LD-endopeptidase LytH
MGTSEKFVSQGTLIGYQGDYSPPFPVAVQLHLSIVTSEADGSFKNEAILDNTLDPSPYFGFDMNADNRPERPVRCLE